jgi:flagellar protein FlgJ
MDALHSMTNRTAGSAGPAKAQDAGRDPVQLAKLRRAAQEFEALFVRTLLRAMRNTIPESGIIDDQGEIKYYRQLFDEELADTAAGAGGGLGVAQMIMRQYEHSAMKGAPAGSPANPVTQAPAAEDALRRPEALIRYREAGSVPEAGAPRLEPGPLTSGSRRNTEAP